MAGRRNGRRAALALAVANAGGMVGGALLDAALGDPRRFHPTAGYGRDAGALERRLYAPTRPAGAAVVAAAAGVPGALPTPVTLATPRPPRLPASLAPATPRAAL